MRSCGVTRTHGFLVWRNCKSLIGKIVIFKLIKIETKYQRGLNVFDFLFKMQFSLILFLLNYFFLALHTSVYLLPLFVKYHSVFLSFSPTLPFLLSVLCSAMFSSPLPFFVSPLLSVSGTAFIQWRRSGCPVLSRLNRRPLSLPLLSLWSNPPPLNLQSLKHGGCVHPFVCLCAAFLWRMHRVLTCHTESSWYVFGKK